MRRRKPPRAALLASLLPIVLTTGCAATDSPLPVSAATQTAPGLTVNGIAFTPADIENITVQPEPYSDFTYGLFINLSPRGAEKFIALQQDQIGQKLELAVDGKVISEPILQDYIYSGNFVLNGGFSAAEADELARKIAPNLY